MKLEVFVTMDIHADTFRNITICCILQKDRRFEGTYRLYFQVIKVMMSRAGFYPACCNSKPRNIYETRQNIAVFCSAISISIPQNYRLLRPQ
jgi:hypothetical protein